jgi:hypothetical protein
MQADPCLIAGTTRFRLLMPPLDGSETVENAPFCAKKVFFGWFAESHKVYEFVALLGFWAQAQA